MRKNGIKAFQLISMHSDDRLVTVINTTDKTTKDRLYKSANSLHRLGFITADSVPVLQLAG